MIHYFPIPTVTASVSVMVAMGGKGLGVCCAHVYTGQNTHATGDLSPCACWP